MPAWSWLCKSRSLLKTRKEFVCFLSGNNCQGTRLQTADIRVLWGWWGWWLRAMSEWVSEWVGAPEGTPDSPLVAQRWQTAAGGDRMSGEVWARETHKSFISSGLRVPPPWKSGSLRARLSAPGRPPYQQQDVLVFCFPCTRVLTRVCKHKWNSALPQ